MRRIYFAVALMSLLAISCEKNNPEETNPDAPYHAEVSFKSEIVGPDTKAELGAQSGNGHPVSWTKGDKVWIYYPEGKNNNAVGAVFTAKESTRTSQFSNSDWASTVDYTEFSKNESYYYAFYPYNSSNKDPNGNHAWYYGSYSYGLVRVYLPQEQIAIPGKADPVAMIMSATTKSKDDPFKFYNAVSLLEFSISVPEGYSVTSVEIAVNKYATAQYLSNESRYFNQYYTNASDNEVMTWGEIAGGRYLHCPDARSFINQRSDTNHKYSVTLKAQNDTPFSSSQTYYAAIWPGQKDGFKVILKGTDGEGNVVTFTKQSSKQQVFAKGKVYPLGTIGSTDASVWTK